MFIWWHPKWIWIHSCLLCRYQGLTVEQDENGNLIVARILADSTVDKAKILHPGDVILEINGISVVTPEELMDEVAQSKSTLQFRIATNNDSEINLKPQKVRYCREFMSHCIYDDSLIETVFCSRTLEHYSITIRSTIRYCRALS